MAKAIPLKENIVPEHYLDAPPKLAPEMTAKPDPEPVLTKYTDEDGNTIIAEVLATRSYENSKGKVHKNTVLLNTNIDQKTGKRKGRPNEIEAQVDQVSE